MVKGSAAKQAESEDVDDCPRCGYTPRRRDRHQVVEYDVVHVRCYRCGEEWVE